MNADYEEKLKKMKEGEKKLDNIFTNTEVQPEPTASIISSSSDIHSLNYLRGSTKALYKFFDNARTNLPTLTSKVDSFLSDIQNVASPHYSNAQSAAGGWTTLSDYISKVLSGVILIIEIAKQRPNINPKKSFDAQLEALNYLANSFDTVLSNGITFEQPGAGNLIDSAFASSTDKEKEQAAFLKKYNEFLGYAKGGASWLGKVDELYTKANKVKLEEVDIFARNSFFKTLYQLVHKFIMDYSSSSRGFKSAPLTTKEGHEYAEDSLQSDEETESGEYGRKKEIAQKLAMGNPTTNDKAKMKYIWTLGTWDYSILIKPIDYLIVATDNKTLNSTLNKVTGHWAVLAFNMKGSLKISTTSFFSNILAAIKVEEGGKTKYFAATKSFNKSKTKKDQKGKEALGFNTRKTDRLLSIVTFENIGKNTDNIKSYVIYDGSKLAPL